MTRKDAQREARKILRELDIIRPPVPIEKIAKHLGAQIRFSPLDDEISGMVYIKDGAPIIGVNSLHHPNRQRFTIAHECGHLRLHRDLISKEVHVDKKFEVLRRDHRSAAGTNPIEVQANQFAADLMMPRDFLLEALGDEIIDIDEAELVGKIARQFRMSPEAIRVRISNLFGFIG
jgi:Zn-dependent peptidase ImmA (M78 family)